MEPGVYDEEARVEADHWWFVGRRRLFQREIASIAISRDAPALDAGTGAGANLRLLRSLGFTAISGLDSSPIARRYCAEKGFPGVSLGDIQKMPFADAAFDLVLATDVIEHVADDDAAIRELHRVLRPGGRALITVPTFMALWGFQDEVAQHKRRYRLGELLTKLRAAGFEIGPHYYFNFILLVPILIARRLMRWIKPSISSENQINNRLLNRILSAIFRADVFMAPWLRMPFGVSALVVARRPAATI